METIAVLWPNKFGDDVVNINRSDFDPAIHKIPGEQEASETVSPAKPRKTKLIAPDRSDGSD